MAQFVVIVLVCALTICSTAPPKVIISNEIPKVVLLPSDGVQASSGAGSSVSFSAGTNNNVPGPAKRPADLYDNIFNIPISVLQAVNQLLGGSPRLGGSKVAHSRNDVSSSFSASSMAHAHTGHDTSGHASQPIGTFFDGIFNHRVEVIVTDVSENIAVSIFRALRHEDGDCYVLRNVGNYYTVLQPKNIIYFSYKPQ